MLDIFRRKSILLQEAPEDEAGGDAPANDAPAEDAGGAEDAPANDEGGGDDTPNEDNTDFNIDASDDFGGGDDTGGDTGSSDTGGSSSGENEAETDNAAKKKDREIYDSLSPQEQKIKSITLRKQFMDLYDRCGQIVDKYDETASEYDEFIEPIKKCILALYNIRDMISTYLLYMYDSNTYIQNDIMFNRYLTALNAIKMVTIDLRNTQKEAIAAAQVGVLDQRKQANI